LLIKYLAIKAYRGLEVELHVFFPAAVEGDE
jgi:hypothetical protein